MPPAGSTPSLRRRLACFVYEGVLLYGVVMAAGWLYSALTQQRHALAGRSGLQAVLLVVLAIYFVGFWSHGGQTVAMRTWRIRLLARDGSAVSWPRGLARYLLSWVWFLPALGGVWLAGPKQPMAVVAIVATGVVAYAMTSLLRPDRQYWHDAVCGTRLVIV